MNDFIWYLTDAKWFYADPYLNPGNSYGNGYRKGYYPFGCGAGYGYGTVRGDGTKAGYYYAQI